MASVRVHTGAFPSAKGVDEGYALGQVVAKWQSVASGAFPRDCSWLLNMVQETDELRLWEKDVDGFRYKDRDEFLREQVLIDFDLTEQQFNDIIAALKGGAKGGLYDVASVEPAGSHGGARDGAGRPAKDAEVNQVANCALNKPKRKPGKSNADPERVIARLKRDASDNPKAGELLSQIETGEIKPYKAAKAMGYVKAPDPVAIAEKQREKLEPEEQVKIWEQWGRSIPDEVMDRIGIAKEAFLNLDESSQNEFLAWANSVTGDQNGN